MRRPSTPPPDATGEDARHALPSLAPFFTTQGVQSYAELMLRDSVRLAERWEVLAERGAEVEIAGAMALSPCARRSPGCYEAASGRD